MFCPSCGRDNPSDAQFCDGCGANRNAPVAKTPTPSEETAIRSSGSFVGRQRELAELKAALEDSLSGHGRLTMLAGEPGIGKTRIAQELAAHATQWGAWVLWGRCYEEGGAPPYWPWVQAIRSYVHQTDPEQLRAEMGPRAADIAEVLPELREKLPDLEPPPTLEPEQARFRLFNSITTFLKNAAQSQPLMLVLDDLQWADRSSLLLLEFLAREIQSSPLLVLGIYRDVEVSRRHPLSQTLGSLIREQRFLRVQLSGLAEQEVEQFIQTTSGVSPSPGLVETIHRRTDGNPLFVGEVIRMLGQEGIEGSQERITNIPEGVRDAIGRRLDRLSEGCNQILTTASVVSREFDFSILRALSTDLAEESLLQLIDEALEAHMIQELPGGRERYQFSHVLVQETLSEELSTSRKVRLHARIAEILEELHGDDAVTHAAELAYHFAQAEPVVGSAKLVHYSLLAGEQALGAYAWEEALAHFSRGLDGKEGQPMDAERAALLFGLGRAQAATLERHRLGEALASLSLAFDYYAEVGDVAGAVAIAQSPTLAYFFRSSSEEAAKLLARAFALVPPDSPDAGSLLTRYVGAMGLLEADYSRAMEAFGQGLAIARRAQDITLEMATTAQAAQVERFHLHPRRGLEKSLRAIELASLVDDPSVEILGRGVAAGCSLVVGDLEGARVHAAAMLSLAERLGHRWESARAFWWNAEVARLEGDWLTAYEHSDHGLEVDPRDSRLLGTRAVLECELGEIAQSEAHLEQLLETWRLGGTRPPGYPVSFPAAVIPVVSRITGVVNRLDTAKEAAEALLSSPAVVPLQALTANTGLALIAVRRGDVLAAAEQYAALESQRGTMLPGWIVNADHLLAILSQTMGNHDQTVVHFEDALAFCRNAGYRPELAWTCCDYAEARLERASPGDRFKVVSLMDESLAISTELGMQPLTERVVALQERAESRSRRGERSFAPTYPDGLTRREVEVLNLMAIGESNRQIAKELFLSVRTVERHVTNIYAKIDARGRADATAYAFRQGISSPP